MTVTGGFDHPPGQHSFVCGRIVRDPARAGVPFEALITGPAAAGMPRFTQLITNVGRYSIDVTVTIGGATQAAHDRERHGGAGGCP